MMRFIHELKDKAEGLQQQWAEEQEQRRQRQAEKQEEQIKLYKRRQAISALEDVERRSTKRSVAAKELDGLVGRISQMSGREFEYFVARIFRALAYEVKLTEVTGDQGVDVLAEKDGERLAIQCKNLARAANNKPVQEVYAGSHYYRAARACVVAPGGYTDGAFELANRLGVELYNYKSVLGWIAQVDLSDSEFHMTDVEVYEALLAQELEYIELLVEAARARERGRHESEVVQRFEKVKSIIDEKLARIVVRMDAIEDSYPEEMQGAQTTRVGGRAAIYQTIAFLGSAIHEGIEIVHFKGPLYNDVLTDGAGHNKPKVTINPIITIPEEESADRVREMFARTLREHSDNYSIQIIPEPRVETNHTTSSE